MSPLEPDLNAVHTQILALKCPLLRAAACELARMLCAAVQI